MSTRSLTETGMPCSGPRYRPLAMSFSARAASASARSVMTVMNARSASFSAAMRSRHARVSSTGETSRRSIRRAASTRLPGAAIVMGWLRPQAPRLRARGPGVRIPRPRREAPRSIARAFRAAASTPGAPATPRRRSPPRATQQRLFSSERERSANADRDHVHAVRQRRVELVDGVREREVDAERSRRHAPAAFDEPALAVELIRRDLADAADHERMRPEAPPRRAVAHVHAGAEIVRAPVRQIVRRDGRGSGERDVDVGQARDAAADRQRRPLTRPEGINRRADRLGAVAEFTDRHERLLVPRLVLERLQVDLVHRLSQQILERMLPERKRLHVLLLVAEADEVLARFLRLVDLRLRRPARQIRLFTELSIRF